MLRIAVLLARLRVGSFLATPLSATFEASALDESGLAGTGIGSLSSMIAVVPLRKHFLNAQLDCQGKVQPCGISFSAGR